jgi:AraC family transcriptional regulator
MADRRFPVRIRIVVPLSGLGQRHAQIAAWLRGGLAPRQMRRVLDYINAHLADELGLVELAAIAGLSPNHFGEAFKVSVGKSPHRFVMERRVQHAMELLRNEVRSIAEIAHATGFSIQSRMTENFRRVTGLTPGQFRRSLS